MRSRRRFSGRGETFGRTLTDFNAFLAKFEPSLPQLSHDLQTLPDVAAAYADAAPDLLDVIRNASRISDTLVDEKSNLDRFLVSSIGLADIGNDVIGGNREPLANLMHVLAPTTDLTNEYHEALNCALTGMLNFAFKPPGSGSGCIRPRRTGSRHRPLPLSAGPAQGRRDRRTPMQGAAAARVQHLPAEGHRRHRHGPDQLR